MEGNQMKMREAIDAALRFIGNLEIEPYSPLDEAASELRQRIMDALSAPPRQCDVGTAEEQAQRFEKFCKKSSMSGFGASAYCAYECACKDGSCCEFAWAQTPYEAEEGGTI